MLFCQYYCLIGKWNEPKNIQELINNDSELTDSEKETLINILEREANEAN